MKELSRIFAENLKYHRKKAGMTQKDLSIKMRYSEKAVSKWETGTTIPPAETLLKLAELFQTSIDDMFEYERAPRYYLGIDGGATKTMFALADASGRVIRHLCLSGCNPVDIGFDKAEAILGEGIHEVCKDISCTEVSLFAGISGGNTGSNEKVLEDFFRRFKFASIGIGNDALNIISAGLGEDDGISVIMGTGSVAFTQKKGKHKQYGGFGYLFDNGGNGYSIGRDAIHAALYDESGCGEHTLITGLLAKENGASAIDMETKFYERGKRYIASFSHIVFEAYDKGDKTAENILRANMAEIANLIDSALADFEKSEMPVRVVAVGGLTKRSDVLFKFINESLKDKNAINLSVYPYEPVIGAVRRAGAPIDTQSDNGITRG